VSYRVGIKRVEGMFKAKIMRRVDSARHYMKLGPCNMCYNFLPVIILCPI
jgi:hypothetical protein